MDVANVGSGGLGRRAERVVEIARREPGARKRGSAGDSATISDESRENLSALRDLVDRLASPDQGRRQLVDAARARLDAGELDTEEVFRRAAGAILRGEA